MQLVSHEGRGISADCSEDCKLKTNSKIPGRAPVQLLGLLEGHSWS